MYSNSHYKTVVGEKTNTSHGVNELSHNFGQLKIYSRFGRFYIKQNATVGALGLPKYLHQQNGFYHSDVLSAQ